MSKIAIPIDQEAIAELCKRNQIRRLALFGSVVRDDFLPESDVDVLVEFAPEKHIGYIGLGKLEEELSPLLDGRRIDFVTYKYHNHLIRERVLAEAQTLYDEDDRIYLVNRAA